MNETNAYSIDTPAEESGLTRRKFLGRVWWAAAGVLVAETAGGLVASLWPRLKPGSFGTKVHVTTVEEASVMPVGTVMYFMEQRFYLSRVDAGFLAMYRKCTHVGCVVPWRPDDPSEDDLAPTGRFACPCHGGVFDRYGVVHAGPPLRPLDLFPISVEKGELVVDTGTIIQRHDYEASQATEV